MDDIKPEQHPDPELIRFTFHRLDDLNAIEFVDLIVQEGGVRLLRRVADALFAEGLHDQLPGLRLRGGKLEPIGRNEYELTGVVVEWPLTSVDGGAVPDLNSRFVFEFERCTRCVPLPVSGVLFSGEGG